MKLFVYDNRVLTPKMNGIKINWICIFWWKLEAVKQKNKIFEWFVTTLGNTTIT
jgi:hypothetical protein